MKKIFFLVATLFSTLSAIAAPTKTIRFATEATYPPFEYIDNSGQIKGFDIDIANALCQQMKVQCTFSNQGFNSLIPSLKIGKFDALISALGITPEREKQVAFTDSYYQPSASFVAALQKKYKLSDLPGKTIGVQQSSTFEKYLREKYGNQITIKSYASVQDAFLDLSSERVDLVIADTPIADAWLKEKSNNKQYGMVEKSIFDVHYFGSGYGIAVRKDDVELLKALNQALSQIKINGQYKKIADYYFAH